MKLVFLMYLEDDDALVQERLEALHIPAFSRIQIEGHGSGAAGWYGDVPPYRSKMVFAVLPEGEARSLLDAVERWPGGQDPHHPVRAFQVDIEEAVTQITNSSLGEPS